MEKKPYTGDSLSSRTISAFPLSIGTSLAFESVFSPRLDPYDPERKIPTHIEISEYGEIWININTLYRNMIGAMSKEAFLNSNEKDFKDALLQEMDVINSLLSVEGNGLCKAVYYFCTYDKLYKQTHSSIKFRQDTTDLQKAMKFKLMKAVKLLEKETEEFHLLDTELKPQQKVKTLILTHIPYDLVHYSNFGSLTLLESHTGLVKKRFLWNTKFHKLPDGDLSHIPFYKKTMLLFGDKYLIHPTDIRIRRQIVEIADKYHWTALTTEAKIMADMNIAIKEPFVLEFIRAL
jgi:hypothetical protein